MKNIKRSQNGFTLIEAMVAVSIVIMLASFKLYPMYIEARMTKAAAQGKQLATWSNSVATYSTIFYNNLVNGTSIAGVADVYAPTVAELRALGLISATFSATNMYNGNYGAKITKTPIGCVAPNCDIENLAYLTNAITNSMNGRLDLPVLGKAAQTLGEDAGYSDLSTPGTIQGPQGSWSVVNPVGNVAGILVMRSGYNSSAMGQFMRRDGALPATGAQNMGGQDVNNVNGLRSTSITNTGNATVGGALGVTGQTTTNGITNNGALQTGNTTINGTAAISGAATIAGNLAVTGTSTLRGVTNTGNITNTGSIQSTGNIVTNGDVETGRLYLRTVVANGASCAGFTGYQAATAAGSIASCINGTWQTPAANIPPPSPCSSTSVNFMGCTGTVPYTQHAQTASVTVTSGSGNAVYSCNNGSWAFQSGNCTPPPAGCAATTVYWAGGASCSGSSASLAHGSGRWVNSTNGNSGSVYASCNNGSISTSSGSCTAPARTFYNPTDRSGQALASNPGNRASFCQAQGMTAVGNGTESDLGGSDVPHCYSADGTLRCTFPSTYGVANCKDVKWGNPGCYIQTSVTCQ
jgi:Tfp pilus assembly protein PilE